MKNTKNEWIEDSTSLVKSCITDLLKFAKSDSIRVVIVSSCPIEKFASYKVNTCTHTQTYKFGLKNFKDVSEITIYQEELSRANAGISFESRKDSVDSITNFLISKMVWQ